MLNIDKCIAQIDHNFQSYVHDFDRALKLNLELLINFLPFDRASFFLYEEQSKILYPKVIISARGEMEVEGEIHTLDNPSNNFCRALAWGKEVAVCGHPDYAVFLPLASGNNRVGVLRLDNYLKPKAVKKSDISVAKKFAEPFYQGIYNCQTYQNFHIQIKKLTTLTKIAGVMATALRMEDVLNNTLTALVKDMGFDRAHVYLIDENTKKVTQSHSVDFLERSSTQKDSTKIDLTLNSFLLNEKSSFLSKKYSTDLIGYSTIYWQGKKKGFLVVDNLFSRQLLKREDMAFLDILANQLGILIENSRLFEKVQYSSITDGLTGLFNHHYFYDRLQSEIVHASHGKFKLFVLICDLDHFKKFNDAYGHPAGDKALKSVADILRKSIRSVVTAARYGGEEFAVILPGADFRNAAVIAKRILDSVGSHVIKINDKPVKVTISIGVACYPDDAKEKLALVKRADQALYHSKSHGRNMVTLYSRSCKA